MRQGTVLTASHAFDFKKSGKGRTYHVKKGDRFWVTNSQSDQNLTGFVLIDREGKGYISQGTGITPDQLLELFTWESK